MAEREAAAAAVAGGGGHKKTQNSQSSTVITSLCSSASAGYSELNSVMAGGCRSLSQEARAEGQEGAGPSSITVSKRQ